MTGSWQGSGGQFKITYTTTRAVVVGDQLRVTFNKASDISLNGAMWSNFGSSVIGMATSTTTIVGDAAVTLIPSPNNVLTVIFNIQASRATISSDITNAHIYVKSSSSPTPSPTTAKPTSPPSSAAPTTKPPTTASPAPTTAKPTASPTTKPPTSSTAVKAYDSCGSGKKIAITFDDGTITSNSATATVLDVLKSIGIKASFFISPNNYDVEDLYSGKCTLVARIVSEGHYVGCHSWDHPDFTSPVLSNSSIASEISQCTDYVKSCSGVNYVSKHFRPPYGDLLYSQASYISNSLGLTTAFWNIDSDDWRTVNDYAAIWSNVNSRITAMNNAYSSTYGPYTSVVLLFHDYASYNARSSSGTHVLKTLYDTWGPSGIGYSFVTVDQCYNDCNTIVDGGICKNQRATHYQLCTWPHTGTWNGC
jgi:peptidoglycan/xylan/chitin deacetylase (PgdA/CDA1 family)